VNRGRAVRRDPQRRRGRGRVVGEVGQRLLDEGAEGLAADGVFERRGVQGERRFDRRPLGFGRAVEEVLGAEARGAEGESETIARSKISRVRSARSTVRGRPQTSASRSPASSVRSPATSLTDRPG
jgi:hypothetical protein